MKITHAYVAILWDAMIPGKLSGPAGSVSFGSNAIDYPVQVDCPEVDLSDDEWIYFHQGVWTKYRRSEDANVRLKIIRSLPTSPPTSLVDLKAYAAILGLDILGIRAKLQARPGVKFSDLLRE